KGVSIRATRVLPNAVSVLLELRRDHLHLHSFPNTTLFRSVFNAGQSVFVNECLVAIEVTEYDMTTENEALKPNLNIPIKPQQNRSEEHTSELQSRENLVCRLLLEKKNSANIGVPWSQPVTH